MTDAPPTLPLPGRETAALVESVKDYAILMLDPAGHILTWNEGARAIKGWTEEEIVGQSFTRFYTADDLASRKPWRLLDEAVAQGRVEDEGWRVRKDGTRFWADVVITPLHDEHGGVRGYVKVVRDLTERRAAEDKLRQSEERMRLLIDSVKDYAIFMLGADGTVASWNTGAERMKGWTAREVIGRHISIFYPPELAAAQRPIELLRTAASVGRVEVEGWRVRKDGTRFWADVVISRIDGDDGRLLGFSKVTRDLTERRAVEQALRDSEERTRLMIASVKDYAIFMLDPMGRVTTWNPGAERLKGYTAEQAIGKHFEVFYPDADRQIGKPLLELEIAEREGRYEEEGWRCRRDGTRLWAHVVISAVRDAAGTLVGFTKVTRDQTEQRRSAQRLEARARQQAATAALGVAVLRERDPDAITERAVRTIRDVLDADLVAVLMHEGGALKVVASAGWRDRTRGTTVPIDVATLAGRAYARREPVTVADFEATDLLARSTLEREHGARSGAAVVIPAPRPESPAHGVVVALRREPSTPTEDISFLQGVSNVIAAAIARAEDEQQLRMAELAAAEQRSRSEQAERELRTRDEFISVAAHELRTPLNALQLNLHALERALGEPRSERVQNRVDGALRQSHRLTHLIARLLDVSRIASGTVEIFREPVDLADLARDVVESLRETARNAGSEVVLEASGEATREWDRTRLEQITTNLVSNAINYGNGKPIEIRVHADAERARLTVEDHGIGIAPADVERIFGRFERAVPVRNYAGLGLGLYIAQHIVDAHGGTIKVDSELGRGARFVVDLPRLMHSASEHATRRTSS